MNEQTKNKIEQAVRSNNVMLFMKGTPDFPQCGFSARAVECLERVGASYATANVLDDWDLREGIKEYSSWPTIPQCYIAGEFIGGCDIIMQMFESGELRQAVEQAGAVRG